MNYTDTDLSALLDGELNAIDAKKLRDALVADEALADRLEQLAFSDAVVKSTYQAIDSEPLPATIVNLLAEPSDVVSESEPNVVAFPRVAQFQRPMQIAAALMLGLGVIFGSSLLQQPASDIYAQAITIGPVDKDSTLYPILSASSSAVAHHLHGSADDAEAAVAITPVLSFQSKEGSWCREYTVSKKSEAARALACAGSDNQWQIVLSSLEQNASAQGEYATASTVSSAAFDAFIDARIVGEPLSASEEKELIERAWQVKD